MEIEHGESKLFYLSPGDNEIPDDLLDVTVIKSGIKSGKFIVLRK
ncbi:hypothetical protein QMM44_01295 [Leptospira santarosai]|nr:hypothetical protein [Leptospira santarosai]EMO20759.1 hypothetical protein LEP1GSC168_0052 [Leptospira santarosai str. HAI134]MDI7202086.1 hypothetical protein [Leptospira santarosai]